MANLRNHENKDLQDITHDESIIGCKASKSIHQGDELIMQTIMENTGSIPKMKTIKEIAQITGLAYGHINKLCKENKIVHIRAGNRFLINLDKFVGYLNNGENWKSCQILMYFYLNMIYNKHIKKHMF